MQTPSHACTVPTACSTVGRPWPVAHNEMETPFPQHTILLTNHSREPRHSQVPKEMVRNRHAEQGCVADLRAKGMERAVVQGHSGMQSRDLWLFAAGVLHLHGVQNSHQRRPRNETQGLGSQSHAMKSKAWDSRAAARAQRAGRQAKARKSPKGLIGRHR